MGGEPADNLERAKGFEPSTPTLAVNSQPDYPAVYLGILRNACRLSVRTEQAIDVCKAITPAGFGLTAMVIAYRHPGRSEEARRTADQ